LLGFGRVQQRGAAFDTDGLKAHKHSKLYGEKSEPVAVVKNQISKPGQKQRNVIGQALKASVAEVEKVKICSPCGAVSTQNNTDKSD
jgi:hypothetical protein